MDACKLDYEIKRKGYDIQDFCKIIGMSRTAFYRKKKGISEFTMGEINKIVKVLGLESPMEIFFADKVS